MSKRKRTSNPPAAPANGDGDGHAKFAPAAIPAAAAANIGAHVTNTEPFVEEAEYAGSIGRTMFDMAGSQDGSVTGLTPPDELENLANQALVRIKSVKDDRVYLGAISSGPFVEPDGLRADAPVVVTATVRGGLLMPRYHGRMQISLIAEELDGKLVPPRRRPLPNSPVFLLSADETAKVLNCAGKRTDGESGGDICLGVVEGMEGVEVFIPTDMKSVLPRHLGIIGTTGGGKSTTVSGFVDQLQAAGWAVILLDTEGEYTCINDPTTDDNMHAALHRRNLKPRGVKNTHLYTLVGCKPANRTHPSSTKFTLPFSDLSPYAVAEILEFPDAQTERFFKAYDITKTILEHLKIQKFTLEVDELDSGYPNMTLHHVADTVNLLTSAICNNELTTQYIRTPKFKSAGNFEAITKFIKGIQKTLPSSPASWKGLSGRLSRVSRLNVFDRTDASILKYADLLQPGRVSIFDLSDMDAPVVNNLAIAMLLRGIQQQQDENYDKAEKTGQTPTPTIVLIEEAHEFLSADRIKQMPTLFSQVAKIAKRGRKRWLALGFITQLPQHLPDEVLALINNWVLHKISDANVISRLRRSIGGIDDALWSRLLSLAPGQAIASFGHLTRALQVAIDPTPCRLKMVD